MKTSTETAALTIPAAGTTFTRGNRTWTVIESTPATANTVAATRGHAVADITARCGKTTLALFSLRATGEMRKVYQCTTCAK